MREHPTPITILHRGIQQKALPPCPHSNNLRITKTLHLLQSTPPPTPIQTTIQDGIALAYLCVSVFCQWCLKKLWCNLYNTWNTYGCLAQIQPDWNFTWLYKWFNCNILHLKTPKLILTPQQAAICTDDLRSLICMLFNLCHQGHHARL